MLKQELLQTIFSPRRCGCQTLLIRGFRFMSGYNSASGRTASRQLAHVTEQQWNYGVCRKIVDVVGLGRTGLLLANGNIK